MTFPCNKILEGHRTTMVYFDEAGPEVEAGEDLMVNQDTLTADNLYCGGSA